MGFSFFTPSSSRAPPLRNPALSPGFWPTSIGLDSSVPWAWMLPQEEETKSKSQSSQSVHKQQEIHQNLNQRTSDWKESSRVPTCISLLTLGRGTGEKQLKSFLKKIHTQAAGYRSRNGALTDTSEKYYPGASGLYS